MTKVPTTLVEAQALVDRLDAALKARDLPKAKVDVTLRCHALPQFFATTEWLEYGSKSTTALMDAEGIAKIEAFIADQPTGKEKAEREAVKAMAAAVEAARAADWPDDWINPMAATLQRASDNLLTYRPEVAA